MDVSDARRLKAVEDENSKTLGLPVQAPAINCINSTYLLRPCRRFPPPLMA